MRNSERISKIRKVMLTNSIASSSSQDNAAIHESEMIMNGIQNLNLSILAYENWKMMANFILHENMHAFRKSCKYINKALYLELRDLAKWLEKEESLKNGLLVHNHSEEKLDENKQENSTKAKSNKASSKHRKQSEQEPPRIIVDTEFFVANNEPRQSRERQLDNNFDSDSESEIENEFNYEVPNLLTILNDERNRERNNKMKKKDTIGRILTSDINAEIRFYEEQMNPHPSKVKLDNSPRIRRTHEQDQDILNSFKTMSSHTFEEEGSNVKADQQDVNHEVSEIISITSESDEKSSIEEKHEEENKLALPPIIIQPKLYKPPKLMHEELK